MTKPTTRRARPAPDTRPAGAIGPEDIQRAMQRATAQAGTAPKPAAINYGGHGTPEEFFAETQPAGMLAIDALTCALSRAAAVLSLVTITGDAGRECFMVSHDIVMDALWTVEGLIDQAQAIARRADEGARHD